MGTFVLVVLGLNRGKDPTETIKKSFRNGREASGSLGEWGGAQSRSSLGAAALPGFSTSPLRCPTARDSRPHPHLAGGSSGAKEEDPRGLREAAGRPAAAPRARPRLRSPGPPPRPAELPPSRGGALRPLPPGSPCPSPKMAASEGEPEGGGGRRAGA